MSLILCGCDCGNILEDIDKRGRKRKYLHYHTKKNILEDVWEKINIGGEDDCWEWVGNIRKDGYADFTVGGKKILVHRAAYQTRIKEIPKDICVLHTCDNRKCCNPKHLFLGTQCDNIKDMIKKERNAKGNQYPNTKLNKEKVFKIKKLYSTNKYSQKELAKQFNVDASEISRVINNKIWGWLHA